MTILRIAGPEPARVARLVGLGLCLLTAGCATGATIEDAVPVSAESAAAVPMGGGQVSQQPAFSQPGQYPNLNVVPVPAQAQITPAERTAEAARLRATRAAVAGQGQQNRAIDDSAELRRLARTHADAALKQIEGE